MPALNEQRIKTLSLLVLLAALSYAVTRNISQFVRRVEFLKITPDVAIATVLLLLLVCYIYSFLLCSNSKHTELLLTPLALVTGIILGFPHYDLVNTLVLVAIALAISISGIEYERSYKHVFLKFNPRTNFRIAISTLTTVFSVVAGFAFLVRPQDISNLDVGRTVASVITEPIHKVVSQEIESTIEQAFSDSNLIPKNMLTNNSSFIASKEEFGKYITEKINKAVQPYTNFLQPSFAVAVFLAFQLLDWLVIILFTITINPLIQLATKAGILKVTKVQVEQEQLTF